MTDLPAIVGAAMSDVLSILQVGGTSVTGAIAQGAVAAYLRRRAQDARDILLEEFRQARIDRLDVASEDELGGVLFRYFSAIRDNAARLNLRLMAKVMVGQGQRGQFYADPFHRYATALASLSRDEVIVLSTFLRLWLPEIKKGGKLEKDLHRELEAALVPAALPTVRHVKAALTSGSRSGLLYRLEGAIGHFGYYPSPLLEEVGQLADFQDALRAEGISTSSTKPSP